MRGRRGGGRDALQLGGDRFGERRPDDHVGAQRGAQRLHAPCGSVHLRARHDSKTIKTTKTRRTLNGQTGNARVKASVDTRNRSKRQREPTKHVLQSIPCFRTRSESAGSPPARCGIGGFARAPPPARNRLRKSRMECGNTNENHIVGSAFSNLLNSETNEYN